MSSTMGTNATALVAAVTSLDRHSMMVSFEEGFYYTLEEAMQKDKGYTLFRKEDWLAWVIFTVVFFILIIFDNVILNRNPKALTITRAVLYSLFWVLLAGCFCTWVYFWFGPPQAFMWASGYMLEWMLSFDNLFVFHMIFSVYGTPNRLKHKPLFWGICGAVFFRLVFIFVGEYLMHTMFFMRFVFGGFLIYTGVKTALTEDDDEDPSQHPAVQFLQARVPFVSAYDTHGAFFVRVKVDERGEPILPEPVHRSSENDSLVEGEEGHDEPDKKKVDTYDFAAALEDDNGRSKTEKRATMLFLVVVCLEISDILFAVDSVSAIVAAVNDLFLAYTSAVFAMLGLRATFFIIDVLVSLFSLLKYGVAIVLIFIGIKLIIGKWYHIHPMIVCLVLFGAIGGSMLASYIKEKYWPEEEEEKDEKEGKKLDPELQEHISNLKDRSPKATPSQAHRLPA
eukprot:gnl/TRDRNA2_/TRDRNA2_175313_c0_seq23.p1 gnl/TRDRNA2_/TRDRNA2_175313_c0~~gnl/TRDRNA2_/TRDRNA2_175313_c0_seq23.p1  ORF type:complete len:452 (+),score=123.16 gnl/TRDRNA2_/TRDRNA2_175313_c0_seq23:92-1447(+)